jgi:hypothetical protein
LRKLTGSCITNTLACAVFQPYSFAVVAALLSRNGVMG